MYYFLIYPCFLFYLADFRLALLCLHLESPCIRYVNFSDLKTLKCYRIANSNQTVGLAYFRFSVFLNIRLSVRVWMHMRCSCVRPLNYIAHDCNSSNKEHCDPLSGYGRNPVTPTPIHSMFPSIAADSANNVKRCIIWPALPVRLFK
jgi:hypothetical protein